MSDLTREYLENAYHIEHKSQKRIAEELGVKQWQVSEAMKQYGIQTRPTGRVSNLVGQKFGLLTVIRPMFRRETKSSFRWKCRCDCGQETDVRTQNLLTGITKSCGCLKELLVGNLHHAWTGYGHIPGGFMSKYKSHAKRRGIPFDVTIEYLNHLYVQQEGKCSLTGLPLSFEHYGYKHEFATASLDRTDSTQGYVPGNVTWVHKDYNFMKQSMSVSEFIEACRRVVEYHDKKA